MEKSELSLMVSAHDHIWLTWWNALNELDKSVLEIVVGGSFPTLFETANHLYGAEYVWQERCEGIEDAAFPKKTESIISLNTHWRKLAQRRRDWLEGIDPNAIMTYVRQGQPMSNPYWQSIIHMICHANFHRGQLATQYRLLGLVPPEKHMIGAFRELA